MNKYGTNFQKIGRRNDRQNDIYNRKAERNKFKELYKSKKSKLKLLDIEILKLKNAYSEVVSSKVERFADFPLSSHTLQGLEEAAYSTPTEIQREAIGLALQGNDILGAAKTGSGKTLAFLIPLLECLFRLKWSRMDGLGALVISPTRELAYQTFEVLRKIGKKHDFSAGLVIGGKFLREESAVINQTNIVICTPGRLLQHMDQTPNFTADNLQILILDEADRILDMGFAATMNAIIDNLPQHRQTMLFSATQTKSVKDLARLSLKDPMYVSVHEHAEHSTPKGLRQSYIVCEQSQKLDMLWSFLKSHLKSKILVFFASCKQVKFVYDAFCRLRPGMTVLCLHGSMDQLKRVDAYEEFCRKFHVVLFATDIAARGLDFPAVNWVVQLDCPEDATTYIHRAGRTARYEENGESLLVMLPSEEEAMVQQLHDKKIPIENIKINPRRMNTIKGQLSSLCAENVELKEKAQRAFVSYLRSIFLMSNKKVFNVRSVNHDEFSSSLGLAVAPRVRFLQKSERLKQQGKDSSTSDGDLLAKLQAWSKKGRAPDSAPSEQEHVVDMKQGKINKKEKHHVIADDGEDDSVGKLADEDDDDEDEDEEDNDDSDDVVEEDAEDDSDDSHDENEEMSEDSDVKQDKCDRSKLESEHFSQSSKYNLVKSDKLSKETNISKSHSVDRSSVNVMKSSRSAKQSQIESNRTKKQVLEPPGKSLAANIKRTSRKSNNISSSESAGDSSDDSGEGNDDSLPAELITRTDHDTGQRSQAIKGIYKAGVTNDDYSNSDSDESEDAAKDRSKRSNTREDASKFDVSSDDDDDQFLTVKRRILPPPIEKKPATVEAPIHKKKLKVKTKVAVAKHALKKGIKLNTKVEFDDEGEQIRNPMQQCVVSDEEGDSSDDEQTGINIARAKKRLEREDKMDKKLHTLRVKELHKEKRIKLKEEKRAKSGRFRQNEEHDNMDQGGAEQEAILFNNNEDEGFNPDQLPDPDEVYGSKKEDGDSEDSDVNNDNTEDVHEEEEDEDSSTEDSDDDERPVIKKRKLDEVSRDRAEDIGTDSDDSSNDDDEAFDTGLPLTADEALALQLLNS